MALVYTYHLFYTSVLTFFADKYYSIPFRRLSDRQIRWPASFGHLGLFLLYRVHRTGGDSHRKKQIAIRCSWPEGLSLRLGKALWILRSIRFLPPILRPAKDLLFPWVCGLSGKSGTLLYHAF